MVLWMCLSICMVTSEEVDLCVCVCVTDRERERESLGAQTERKRCSACWMPIRSWRPICSVSFPPHSWGFFFFSPSLWQDSQQKVTAPALLPVTEIRIPVFVCAEERQKCEPMQICSSQPRHPRFFPKPRWRYFPRTSPCYTVRK